MNRKISKICTLKNAMSKSFRWFIDDSILYSKRRFNECMTFITKKKCYQTYPSKAKQIQHNFLPQPPGQHFSKSHKHLLGLK